MGMVRSVLRQSKTFLCTLLFIGVTLPMGSEPLAAQEAWQKVQAFGVQLEVPANWKRFEFRVPRDGHDEIQFAQNARNPTAGAWFSVFPKADEVIDPDRAGKWIFIAGQPARMTDFLSRADEPGPRRRQLIVYFEDKKKPAFLFDCNANEWSTYGPIVARIHTSIRLLPK